MTGGTCGTKTGSEKMTKKAPRLVIGLGDSAFAAQAAARLRGLGWDVTTAACGEEARRLAVRGKAHALVLPAEGRLLVTAKLVTALPRRTKPVLVGPEANEELARVSSYLGAVYVAEADGVGALVDAVLGTAPACTC